MSRTATPNQVLFIVCSGIVLANLDLFIVNVALPDIAREFGEKDSAKCWAHPCSVLRVFCLGIS